MQRSPYIKPSKTEKKSFDKSNTEADFFLFLILKEKKKAEAVQPMSESKKSDQVQQSNPEEFPVSSQAHCRENRAN